MASKYSQVAIGNIFEADGGRFRKLDDLYYEDLTTGFQSVWNPMFDRSINTHEAVVSVGTTNTKDKFLVDQQTRMVKPNPDYSPDAAAMVFAEMWGTAQFDCGLEDYEYIALLSVTAVKSMKQLAKLVGMDRTESAVLNDAQSIIAKLTAAYAVYEDSLLEPVVEPVKKAAPVKKPVAKRKGTK